MKKLLKLFLIMIMVIPFVARADMGAPEVELYQAYVMPEGGADYYDYNPTTKGYDVVGHLDKGTVVMVEYDEENGYFGVLQTDLGRIVRMKGTDIAKVDEVTPDSPYVHKEEKPYNAKVNKIGGLEVRKGPSEKYDYAGWIEKDKVFTVNYSDYDGSYVYIDDGKVKGWVNGYSGDLLYNQPSNYILTKSLKIDKVTAPKDAIVHSEWCTDMWGRSALFEYNDAEALIEVFKNDDMIMLEDEVKVLKTKKTIKTYSDIDYYGDKQKGTLPEGTELYLLGYGVDSNDDFGKGYVFEKGKTEGFWIYMDESALAEVGFEKLANATKQEIKETTTTIAAEPKEVDIVENVTYSTKDVVIISSIVGVVVALTAIVVIVLINKKKKKAKTTTVEATIDVPATPVESFVPNETIIGEGTEEVKDDGNNEEVK